jgi:hypothetical protein
MIQTASENKYRFNMQVSAEDMAALDRDHSCRKAHLGRQNLTRAFNQLRATPRAPPLWKTTHENRPPGRERLSFAGRQAFGDRALVQTKGARRYEY